MIYLTNPRIYAKTKDFKMIFLLCFNIQFVITYCYFHIIKNLFYFASLNRFIYFEVSI